MKCVECKTPFKPAHHRALVCSADCRHQHALRATREWRAANTARARAQGRKAYRKSMDGVTRSRNCKHCDQPFSVLPGERMRLFCSDHCHDARALEAIERGLAKLKAQAAARAVTKSCDHCQTLFDTSYHHARFCSAACRKDHTLAVLRVIKPCLECGNPCVEGHGVALCSTLCRDTRRRRIGRAKMKRNRKQINARRRELGKDPAICAKRLAAQKRYESRMTPEQKAARAERHAVRAAKFAKRLRRQGKVWRGQNPQRIKEAKANERTKFQNACALAKQYMPDEFSNYMRDGPAAVAFCKRFGITAKELRS